jgi:hypothetical protein
MLTAADHPTFFDGEHTNNFLMVSLALSQLMLPPLQGNFLSRTPALQQVSNNGDEKERQDRVRLMSANPCLNEEEQARIKANLMT